MSTIQFARIPALALTSVRDVVDMLRVPARQATLATAGERIADFGRSVASGIEQIRAQISAMPHLSSSPVELQALERALALHASLSQEDNSILRSLAERHLSRQGLHELEALGRIRSLLDEGDARGLSVIISQMERSVKILSAAAKAAHEELAQAEQEVLWKTTTEALESIGYKTERRPRKNGTLVRGTRQDVSIVAEVSADGNFNIDMAGFDGTTCQAELRKLHTALEERGIRIDVRKTELHGKKSGGSLAKQTAAEFNPLSGRQQRWQTRKLLELNRRRQSQQNR